MGDHRHQRPAPPDLKLAKSVLTNSPDTPRTPQSLPSNVPFQRSPVDDIPLRLGRRGIIERLFGPKVAECGPLEISVTTRLEVEADSASTFFAEPMAHPWSQQLEAEAIEEVALSESSHDRERQ